MISTTIGSSVHFYERAEQGFEKHDWLGNLASPKVSYHSSLPSQAKGLPLSFVDVKRAFDHREILKGISVDIPAGQFVAVVGRSGGGKTTVLRQIAGLDQPTSGYVTINRNQISGLQASVRLPFQDARLLPWQTVIGNVGIARKTNWESEARVALNAVGLSDHETDWPSTLSGGQKQRVALARALVSDPSILLLDEPFGALDALTRSEMHRLMERVWFEHGFTAVLITHDVAEAVSLADRVLVLRDGHIALDITIDLPRPRRDYGDAAAAALQAAILKEV